MPWVSQAYTWTMSIASSKEVLRILHMPSRQSYGPCLRFYRTFLKCLKVKTVTYSDTNRKRKESNTFKGNNSMVTQHYTYLTMSTKDCEFRFEH